MISTKFKIILAVILIFGIIGLWATHKWYKDIDNFTSLDKYGDYLKKEFPEVEHISTDSLQSLIRSHEAGVEELVLIDCRSPEEFVVSHIPGAINLETPDAVRDHFKSIQNLPAANVAIYCSVGYRSATLAEEIDDHGANVKNVAGSIFSWANENRPLVDAEGNSATKVHPYNQFWKRLLKEGKAIELPD